MEGSTLRGQNFPVPAAGVMEMDPSLHHLHQQQQQQVLSHHVQGMAPLSTTQQLHFTEHSQGVGIHNNKASTSDEDEPSFTESDFHAGSGKGKKSCPWQRIKWTDSMVRLLISAVFFVGGEDGTIEGTEGNKWKCGLLQKKGKWKAVSCLMNEWGCPVSPQQCEDKFNDLNKRYKRLNDILGKGTACFVVENPSLLDTMDHVSSKLKDDVRKILSSKHLFYKEMCSYHTGCKLAVPPNSEFHPQPCLDWIGKPREGVEGSRGLSGGLSDDELDEDDADDDDSEDRDNENLTEMPLDGPRAVWTTPGLDFSSNHNASLNMNASKYTDGVFSPFSANTTKGARFKTLVSVDTMLDDAHIQPVMLRFLQLQEWKINLQAQALELEKQRFKWERLSAKKQRELEMLQIKNKRMKLENECMSLKLRLQELEGGCLKPSDASIDLAFGNFQAKDKLATLGQTQNLS